MRRNVAAAVVALVTLVAPMAALAQTRIEPPKNKYKISDDVKLGREAAAKIEQQVPILRDAAVDDYVGRVARRLVESIPSQFSYREFDYETKVVNASDINAFALPGGYLYVNRGLIDVARNEGELAGVMAHEIAHIALRHGTAQASRSRSLKYQLPAIGGAVLGAIIGGAAGAAVAQGTQFGVSLSFLSYGRDLERQADMLGAQIMARAGYDPRDLANVFRTIEQNSKRGGPEWMSSHPNPENRYEAINREARALGVSPSRATQNTREFERIQARLREMPPAPTMEQIARQQQTSSRRYPENARISTRVEAPSRNYRTYQGGRLFTTQVPANWRPFEDQTSVTFAPDGAYGDHQGRSVFTHGAIVGATRASSTDLRRASDEFINALLQSNPYLDPVSNYRRGQIDRRSALSMQLAGRSGVTGRPERVTVYTTTLRSGELFYVITVVPDADRYAYDRAFDTLVGTIDIRD